MLSFAPGLPELLIVVAIAFGIFGDRWVEVVYWPGRGVVAVQFHLRQRPLPVSVLILLAIAWCLVIVHGALAS